MKKSKLKQHFNGFFKSVVFLKSTFITHTYTNTVFGSVTDRAKQTTNHNLLFRSCDWLIKPIRDQYFLIRSVPGSYHSVCKSNLFFPLKNFNSIVLISKIHKNSFSRHLASITLRHHDFCDTN